MMEASPLTRGHRVGHPELGEGVLLTEPRNGYVRVFFSSGERQVPEGSLRLLASRSERVVTSVEGGAERLRRVRLAYEAEALPLLDGAAALTAAPIDLLPHQVVLTHRIATASPRRFLVADEVGLGKTIETALVLRELASRGELTRALMVVPAGLVNNWHRELNEVFGLDFEVFGAEGDVTDRRTNAFARHDRLITSIDTLKRRPRVKRLLEAPPWDLVVFDEAHHVNAYRSGTKLTKTENYRLAEALKGHARDLILLSATPHQGDHFRFWMLIHLLNPALFRNADDMVENRHRLNEVVIRRTKADACRPNGDPLFARRYVHTESFTMGEDERRFYASLRDYLEEGFALARRQGSKGTALGFVMAVFQKIAASSFAAVHRTLRRRLIALTLHEAILRDQALDIEGRQRLYGEARALIHREYDLPEDALGRGEAERILADLRVRILRKLSEEDLALAGDASGGELAAAALEDAAATTVMTAVPEERQRIHELLRLFPEGRETKVDKLLRALGALWRENPDEKVVIFATYLGTVELLGREIESAYPGQGVVVLRGGDHGAKLAAERRFKKPDGPRVLVCTAAGREGINLQTARVLFNFDLPWNPMDVEQRIGRIHRYGQHHTAQVYNLVLSDTIEGRIFLLLDEKLQAIARTLGKLDERGNVAEDLRTQILGQLSERLSYEKLYREALSDPELRRTSQELEAALSNATEARQVVFELFQDLDRFSLDEYRPLQDVEARLDRLVHFLAAALADQHQRVRAQEGNLYAITQEEGQEVLRFTTDRNLARRTDGLALMGLDHPLMVTALHQWQSLAPEERGAAVAGGEGPAVLSVWRVETNGARGRRIHLVPLAVDGGRRRVPHLERHLDRALSLAAALPTMSPVERMALLRESLEPMLERELGQRGMISEPGGYAAQLVAWLEIQPA